MSKAREAVVGLAMLGAGAGYLALVGDIPRRGAVDASFVPRVLAGMMLGLGALQLLTAWRAVPEGGMAAPRTPWSSLAVVGTSLALIAGFVALLRPLGFPIATALFLFAQFWLLTPGDRRPRPVLYAIVAVAASAVIFAMFRYGFRLLLPAGPFTPFLP